MLAIQGFDLGGISVFLTHFAVSMVRQSAAMVLSISGELSLTHERGCAEPEEVQWDVQVRLRNGNPSQQLLIGRHQKQYPPVSTLHSFCGKACKRARNPSRFLHRSHSLDLDGFLARL